MSDRHASPTPLADLLDPGPDGDVELVVRPEDVRLGLAVREGQAHADVFTREFLLPREGQHLLRQPGSAFNGGRRGVRDPTNLFVVNPAADKPESAGDNRHQVIEVMGDTARHAAECFKLLSLDAVVHRPLHLGLPFYP